MPSKLARLNTGTPQDRGVKHCAEFFAPKLVKKDPSDQDINLSSPATSLVFPKELKNVPESSKDTPVI